MKNDIENSFKQKFENFEMTPSAGLFDAIQAKIAQKKKRTIWIWSAALLMLAGAGFALRPQTPLANDHHDNPVVKNHTDTKIQLQTTNNVTRYPKSSNEAKAPHKIKTKPGTQDHDTEQRSAQKTKIMHLEKEIPLYSAIPQKRVTDYKPIIEDLTSQKTADSKQKWAQLFGKIEKENQYTDATKNTLYLGTTKQTVDAQPSQMIPTKTQDKAPITDTKSEQYNLINAEKNTESEKRSDNIGPFPTRKLVTISKWRIQASAGAGYASRMLYATTPQYAATRNSSEKNSMSYQLELNAIYQFSPKWNVQSGVNYTQRNEQFYHANTTYTTKSSEVERSETIIHPVLGEIQRTYTETITDTTTHFVETSANNSFHKISIPLVFERSIYTSEKWTMLAKAGVLAGIYANQQGMLLSTASEPQAYTSVPMRTAGIHQMVLGIGAQYHLTPRFSFIAYPQANVQINSSTTSKAEFSQKDWGIFTHIGLRIGL